MKELAWYITATLFFSSLLGLGFTAGVFAYLGVAELIGKLIW